MISAEAGSSGTIRALRVLIIAALIIPALIFATTAWRDRQVIVAGEEGDAAKLLAVFHEQAENLFKGHNIILDLIVERMRNRDWDTLQGSPEILRELESIDKMLDDTSAILLVDAAGQTHASTIHLRGNEPLPMGDKACFRALQQGASNTCVSEPYFDPVSDQHLFSLTRSLEKDGDIPRDGTGCDLCGLHHGLVGVRPAPSHRYDFLSTFGWRHSRSATITSRDEIGGTLRLAHHSSQQSMDLAPK